MSVASHILLATDFSQACETSVDKAAELARVLRAKLTVFHVHGRPPEPPEAVVPSDLITVSADLDRAAIKSLEQLRNSRLSGIESVEVATAESGSVPKAVCEYAAEHDVDLIVIGKHGHTGPGRFLIGSVAERVVRHAPCPVLVFPHA